MDVTIDLDSSYEPDSPEARAFVKSMDKLGIDAKYEDIGGMQTSLLLKGDNKKIYKFLVDVEWFGDKQGTVSEIQDLYPELLYGNWVDTDMLRK